VAILAIEVAHHDLNSYSIALPTTGRRDNMARVTVDLNNPFTTSLDITKISSTVTAFGITLGQIETATNFAAPGKKVTTSPPLDLAMNLDPTALFSLTRALAVKAGLDPTPLDGIVQLGGIKYLDMGPQARQLSNHRIRANEFTCVTVFLLCSNIYREAYQWLQSCQIRSNGVQAARFRCPTQQRSSNR
jgi:hypothetical protein